MYLEGSFLNWGGNLYNRRIGWDSWAPDIPAPIIINTALATTTIFFNTYSFLYFFTRTHICLQR